MTYDDLNEFFWGDGCLGWQPYASRPRCVVAALGRCAKTHVEQHSWLHLVACFSRYLALVLCATFVLCDLAISVDNGVRWWWVVGDTSVLLWINSLDSLLKEVIDLWLEAALQERHRTLPQFHSSCRSRCLLLSSPLLSSAQASCREIAAAWAEG